MGGLFGGGSSKERKPKQELNPPVDTSGSSIPGDDKMMMRKVDNMMANQQAKAGQTLLGRSANDASVGSAPKQPSTAVNYA